MPDLDSLITVENIFSGIVALAAGYAIIDSRLNRKKYSEERLKNKESNARDKGMNEEKMANVIKSLDHAHDKIRVLVDDMNSINTTVIRVQDSIDRLTGVMEKVEHFMDNNNKQVSNIDARLEHVERACHDL